jgi:hypothetical protein
MDIQELDQSLPVEGGSITVTPATAGGLMQAFLAGNGNAPLVVTNATKSITGTELKIGGSSSLLSVTGLNVELDFQVQANGTVTGSLTTKADGASIPLRSLFQTYAPNLPAPPDLQISELNVSLKPGDYSFSAKMAGSPPWNFDIGPTPMQVTDVSLSLTKTSGSAMEGSLKGTLHIGSSLQVDITLSLPGNFVIKATLPNARLSQLITALDQLGVTLPNSFDLSFTESYLLIERTGDEFKFNTASLVNNTGTVALAAHRSGGRWGFAAGVQLEGSALGSLPGLSPLGAFTSFVGLDKILLVLSSLTETGFAFPALSSFDAPSLNGHNVSLPDGAGGVVRGVNVYASLVSANSAGFKLLADYLRVRLDGTATVVLSISVPDPSSASKLFLSVNTDLNTTTHLEGQLGVMLQGGVPAAFLQAAVTAAIQGQPATFTATAIVLPTGVLIAGTMQGTINFSPVRLSNVALVIGINGAGVPSLGFAATIDVADFQSSIAVFFDSTDPRKSMFAGAISGATLLQVATLIAGQRGVPAPIDGALAQFGLRPLQAFQLSSADTPALDARDLANIRASFASAGVTLPSGDDQIFFVVNTPGAVWHLTDLSSMKHYELKTAGPGVISGSLQPQLYCAPQDTNIGALSYPQGINVFAQIDAFLIKAQVRVEISTNSGISADVGVAPIQLVNANVFSITGGGPGGGPRLSMSTYARSGETDPRLQGPHFLLTGTMRLLGFDVAGAYISISGNGLQVDLIGQIAPAVSVDLHGTVDNAPSLNVRGGVNVGIDNTFNGGPLGNIRVQTMVNGSLQLAASLSGGSASVQGSFAFGGLPLATLPPITLDVSTASLVNLAAPLWQPIADVINKALANPEQWLQWVKSGLVQGAGQTAEQVGQVLANVYHQAGPDIARETQKILGYGADGVASALRGAGVAAQAAAPILLGIGYGASQVATSIQNAFGGLGHIDFGIGHMDTPAGPHGDTAQIPHGDTRAPHVDGSRFGIHGDLGGNHIDTGFVPHVDTRVPPHIDTQTHVDRN